MTHYVGLNVSQKTTAICVVDAEGRRIWRGVCATTPEGIERAVRRYAGDDVRIGIETGPMTPWLFHGLREREPEVRELSGPLSVYLAEITDRPIREEGTWRSNDAEEGGELRRSADETPRPRAAAGPPGPPAAGCEPIARKHD